MYCELLSTNRSTNRETDTSLNLKPSCVLFKTLLIASAVGDFSEIRDIIQDLKTLREF